MGRLERLNPGTVVMQATDRVSKAIHDGKFLILNSLTGHTITLPKATGSGATFKFFETVAPTSGNNIIKVIDGVDVMVGQLFVSGTTTASFPTAATSDTITLNRGTTGGASNGEIINLIDIAPGMWAVEGFLNGSGTVSTPFSATVT